jgi:signal-transduction protein with cAMP-binding, CBS, and nucleotidyltransferase domain
MDDNHIRHLPVIDDHTLIGVISMRDINGIFEGVKSAAAEPAFA